MKRHLWLAAFACALSPVPLLAQTYPTKPIRLVVPFPPGGGVDIVARFISQRLSDEWGQAVVVHNRGGAASIIGTDTVAKAAPDGYTLLVTHVAFAMNPAIYAKLPYDTIRDFTQVARVANTTNVLVIHPAVPAKSVKEFIALAKAKPGQLNYAAGGSTHLAVEYFKQLTGTDITHVSYKGTAPALTELMGGQVQMMIAAAPGALPVIKTGRLTALGVTGSRRWAQLPDLPTLSEAGVPGYEFDTWYGVHAPAKTPREIVARLGSEIVRAVGRPDLKQKLTDSGLDASGATPEEFARFVRVEMEKMAKIVKAAGIRPQ